jgi:hypothetical protein
MSSSQVNDYGGVGAVLVSSSLINRADVPPDYWSS